MKLPIMLHCERCWCGIKLPDGWDNDYLGGAVCRADAAYILDGSMPMPWFQPQRPGPENCDGECVCHTGIGMLPRIALTVGEDAIAQVIADEQMEMARRRAGRS